MAKGEGKRSPAGGKAGGKGVARPEKVIARTMVEKTFEGAPIRVLLIDNEPALLDVTRLFLERDKAMSVSAVRKAQEALDLLEGGQFDVVVTDYHLPEMDGLELLTTLRERGDTTPFIIFSGRGREEVAIEALNRGADYYLQKGGDPRAQFAELGNFIHKAVTERRARERLIESERRYRNVVEDQTEFISRFLPDGTHIFVNEAYCRYFGKTREEIIGAVFRPNIPPEDRKRVTGFFTSLSPDNPVGMIQHRIIMEDESIRWQRWSDRAIFDDAGRVVEYQSVGRDVTDVIAAEEQLRESESRFKTLFEKSAEPQLLLSGEGRVVDCNDAFLSLFALEHKDQILGHSPKEFAPEFQPDGVRSVERSDEILRSVMAKGVVEYEWAHLKHDPLHTPVLTDVIVTVIIIAGQPMLHVTVRDITDRKRAEEALRESERRLQTIVMGSPIAMFVIDRNHRVISWNHALEEYSGIPREKILGTSEHWRAFYPEKRPCMADLLVDETPDQIRHWYAMKWARSQLVEGAYEATDYFPRMREGKWLFFTAAPLRDRDGRILGAIETLEDVTDRKRAEEALRTNEQFLSNIFQSIQDGISVLDTEMTIVRVNRTMETWYAHQMPLVGKKCYEAYHGRTARCESCPSHTTLTTGIPANEQVPMRGPNQEVVGWLDLYTFPLFDEATRTTTGVIEYVRDITERRKAEEAIRERDEMIKSLLLNLPVGVYRNTPGIDGQTIMANPIIARMHGYETVEEFMARPVREMYVNPEDRQALSERLMSEDEVLGAELRLKKKDGTPFWGKVSARAIRDESGKILYFDGVLEDVTPLREALDALQASEERYRSIVETTSDIIYAIDPEGTLTYISPQVEELGYTASEIVGHHMLDFVHPEDRERVTQAFQRSIMEGRDSPTQFRTLAKTGEEHYLEALERAVVVNGKVTGARGVIRDVTARYRAEEEIRATATLYRTIFETTGTSTAILDKEGTILIANAESERLFGYTPKELAGKMHWSRLIPPYELPRLTQYWQELHEDPARAEQQYEAELVDRWGNPKFGIINTKLIPGTRHCIISVADITPLRQAEEAIVASEEKFRNLFHSASDAIYLASLAPDQQAGKFLEVNDMMGRMVGYSREELLTMSPRNLDAPELEHVRKTADGDLFASGHVTFETQFISKQGIRVPVEVSSHLFTLRGQQVILSIARDITERKVMQEVERKAFEQIEKNINQLSILNDHLRNPLAVIVGLADLEGGATMQKIIHQAKVIDQIITELDMGWLESEKIREFMRKHYGVGKGLDSIPPKT